MDKQRAADFSRFVGLELKGMIIAKGFTAMRVALAIGRQPAAFNRWLNGKVDIRLDVLCEACEAIGAEPRGVVERAYDRMVALRGEVDGSPGAIGDDLRAVIAETDALRAARS